MKRSVLIVFLAIAVLGSGQVTAEKLKVLIIDGQNNHQWAVTTPLLQRILENTGRFSVDVHTSPAQGEDMSGFHPRFGAYDVVLSNYNGDPWPAAVMSTSSGSLR